MKPQELAKRSAAYRYRSGRRSLLYHALIESWYVVCDSCEDAIPVRSFAFRRSHQAGLELLLQNVDHPCPNCGGHPCSKS